MNANGGKTALFFGSYDPVHMGHLIIAEYFLNLPEIDELWFVVSPQNPFKTEQKQTHQATRKKMLDLAVADFKGFSVCDIEFDMPLPTYTYKTLVRLYDEFPGKEFILLIGADNLQEFDKWKNWKEIIELLPVYVYPRPGYDSTAFDHFPNLHKTSAPVIDISSSLIRKNLAEGRSARFMVPNGVYDFILENKLY